MKEARHPKIHAHLQQRSLRWVSCGDSITQGALHTRGYQSWTQLIEQHLQETLGRPDQVFTTAISGDTLISTVNPNSGVRTPGVRTESEERLRDLHPDLVAVMIGMNDWALGVSSADFLAALGVLVQRIRGWGALSVLVTAQPIRGLDERRPENPRFMEIVREIATEHDALLVDNLRHWERAGLTGRPTLWGDAIHPSAEDHRYLAQHFLGTLGLLEQHHPLARAVGERHAGLDVLPASGAARKFPRDAAHPTGHSDDHVEQLQVSYAVAAEGPHSSRATIVLGDTNPLAARVDGHRPTRSWFRHPEEVRRFELGNLRDYFHGHRLRFLAVAAGAMESFRRTRNAGCVLVPTAVDVAAPASARLEHVCFDLAEQLLERSAAGVMVLRHRAELARRRRMSDLARRFGFGFLDLIDVLPSGRQPSAPTPGRAGMIDVEGVLADLEAANRALEQPHRSCAKVRRPCCSHEPVIRAGPVSACDRLPRRRCTRNRQRHSRRPVDVSFTG